MTAPPTVIQKLKLLRNGKATSRAPICSGIDEVHQAGDERHRHEEDHDHAVGGEDLVVVVRRQVALGAVEGHGLLQPHHHRVGEAAQQHDEAEDHVHDADLLVVDAGEPLVPEVAPEPELGERREQRRCRRRRRRRRSRRGSARAAAARPRSGGRRGSWSRRAVRWPSASSRGQRVSSGARRRAAGGGSSRTTVSRPVLRDRVGGGAELARRRTARGRRRSPAAPRPGSC